MKEEILGNLDYPQNNSEIHGIFMYTKGWALSSVGNDLSIEIYLDDTLLDTIETGLPRLDVEKVHPSISESYTSGFMHRTLLDNFENHNHELKAIAKSKENMKMIGKSTFNLNKNLPPTEQIVPTQRYKIGGMQLFDLFVPLLKIKPYEKILDVGCGIGRLAMPFTKFLKKDGSYDGLDTGSYGIEYCKTHITQKFSNLRFSFSDIYNKMYNRAAKYKAFEYKFPYEDENFDVVILNSVFTHMLPKDMENYLKEIIRVLKKGGRCLITYFLLNQESKDLINRKKTQMDWKYQFEGFWSIDKDIPEKAVAYEEASIRNLYLDNDLGIIEPIHYGNWCGRKHKKFGQDIIVASKINNNYGNLSNTKNK